MAVSGDSLAVVRLLTSGWNSDEEFVGFEQESPEYIVTINMTVLKSSRAITSPDDSHSAQGTVRTRVGSSFSFVIGTSGSSTEYDDKQLSYPHRSKCFTFFSFILVSCHKSLHCSQ